MALPAHQKAVIDGLAGGLTAAQIAADLDVTVGHIWNVCAAARRELGAATNEQAVAIAVATGLVEVSTGQGGRMRRARELTRELARLLDPAG